MKIKIPHDPSSSQSIIDHLTDILSDLNYDSRKCICCNWIDHRDKTWYRCVSCDEPICETCYDKYGDDQKEIYCEGCYSGEADNKLDWEQIEGCYSEKADNKLDWEQIDRFLVDRKELFVWDSFAFCFCEDESDTKCSDDVITDRHDFLRQHIDMIAEDTRSLKQRAYNNHDMYWVNDYYFTLKNQSMVYALYTNLLLSQWCIGKWHRGIEKVNAKIVKLPVENYLDKAVDDFIVPDAYEGFTINEDIVLCNTYYDPDTLEFPSSCWWIQTLKTDTDDILTRIVDILGFRYSTCLDKGK